MNTNGTSLDRLHDIIVPAPVPGWPPAPGWDWVMAFVLLVAGAFALKSFIRWQHNRYRREALAELERLEDQWKKAAERAATLLALAELLKRTALTAFPREEVATLTGTKWFEFLDRTGHAKLFNRGLGATLANATYDPRMASFDDTKWNELVIAIRHWIKHHDPRMQQQDAKTAKHQPTDKPLLPSLSSVGKSSV